MKFRLTSLLIIIVIAGHFCGLCAGETTDNIFANPEFISKDSGISSNLSENLSDIQSLDSADMVLTKPKPEDLINYTERGFDDGITASIAWWMAPDFMENTTEFRSYLRKSSENKTKYPEEKQIFFDFISRNLDKSEELSHVKNDLILFRGISPGVASNIINNSEYRETSFASTSYDITVSLDMFRPRSSDGYQNVLVLQRRSGDHVLYINEDEREYLIPRNTVWHVVKTLDIKNLTVTSDFPLYLGNGTSSNFKNIRLMYIHEEPME